MARIIINRKQHTGYWSIHTHSRYSYNDALPSVSDIVAEAKRLGYSGLGLTDHGNMSGAIELYRECKAAGIKPFPGTELYIVHDRNDKRSKRYHAGVVAYTTQGYRNLIHLSTLSHKNFHHKPLLDLSDFAQLSEEGRTEGLALTTGCFFGMVTQTLVHDGYDAAKSLVATFASWFDTYVEIQMHCIDHGEDIASEEQIAADLYRIAQELSLPVVITQDSHYVRAEDKPLHEALKTMVAWGDDPDDAAFPGDGFHMVGDRWMKEHHSPEIYEAGIKGLQSLVAKNTLTIPEADEYHYRIPSKYDDPQKELQKRVTRRALELDHVHGKYYDALMEELEVVKAAGMAGYLLLVAEVCEEMRRRAMFYQIRGSAAGSLTCYYLGISDLDPLKWKLRFDRFLTKDRTKPPDIDIDVDSERRHELVEWLADSYSVCQIGTFGTYSLTDDDDEGKGSLLVKYYSRNRKRGKGATNWESTPQEDRDTLFRLSDLELASGYGTHAAGLILTQTRSEMDEMVPQMWIASSKTMVSQYNMKIIEDLGFVKLDVLGVKTIAVMRRTLEMLGRSTADGLDWIPLTDRRTFAKIASGDTGGMFQLEGGTTARYVRRLRPTKIADVIAAMALFRPGVMSSGATEAYLNRKHKQAEVPQQHEILAKVTKETYGILLYQDQVIEVLRALDMDVEGLNVILKAVKASNKNVASAGIALNNYEASVRGLCAAKGFTQEDTDLLWKAIVGFKDYSFNRAHSTVYGLTAYRSAYLLQHYPIEYHAALLSVASDNSKKEKLYTRIARSRGVRLLRPNVQNAGTSYLPHPNGKGVVRALSSIRGIGQVAAAAIMEHQPYRDFQDFIDKVNQTKVSGVIKYKKTGTIDTGVLEILKDSGALEILGVDS